jgi:putative Ca2+/H+ antiporter (TMEM165/GDT1 family)
LEAFLISTGLVAIAEIGDKTQLLAIVLAAKFRKPVPILLGILTATLLNHGLAAALGVALGAWLTGPAFQALVGVAFLAMAAWALIPDKPDDDLKLSRGGVFLATAIAFFLVEIGDKTQVATSLLAARFEDIVIVTAGTTCGMMLANAPAVFLGEAATKVIPLRYVRLIAAVLFALLGTGVLLAVLLAAR